MSGHMYGLYYCSENISLALLEYYVHSENIANLPKEILVSKIEFPDEFAVEELKQQTEFNLQTHFLTPK